MSKHKPNRPDKWYSGDYIPKNIDKYNGDVNDIVFRSSWEYKFCMYCDTEERILSWSCETIKIPYNIMDNGNYVTRNYIPDFWIKMNGTDGDLKELIIEIKPQKELEEPKEPKKMSIKSLQNYEYRLKSYITNLNKWEAAEKYCKKRGMDFYILTEKYFDDKQIKLF